MRRYIASTSILSVAVVCVLFAGTSHASTPIAASSSIPVAQATLAPEPIRFVETLPQFTESVRDETLEESAESFLISDVIWSSPDIFASGAWVGGEPLRAVYVKSGLFDSAKALLHEALVPDSAYELVEVPLSSSELEALLLAASDLLREHDVPFTTMAPVPQAGKLKMTAAAGSPLVLAVDPATSKAYNNDSTLELIVQLEALKVGWLAVQEEGSGDSALYDDASPNVGSRIR